LVGTALEQDNVQEQEKTSEIKKKYIFFIPIHGNLPGNLSKSFNPETAINNDERG
jgi:hypothetical protein